MINYISLPNQFSERIHNAGLEILSNTGIGLEDQEIIDHLVSSGCTYDRSRVLIPDHVVENALKTTPSEFILYDREGNMACHLGVGEHYFQTVGGAPFVIDNYGNSRHATLRDLREFIHIVNNLDNIHIATVAITPTDVDESIQQYISFANNLMYTNKTLSIPGVASAKEVRNFLRLVEIVYQDSNYSSKPSFIMSILPSSPLKFPKGLGEAIAETARFGIPISIVPLPVMGVSAPLSFGSALAQQHAENLATIVIAQIIQPGLPMVYHGRLSIGDMRTGASTWGYVDIGLLGACAVEIGKKCGLPTNVYGLTTSAKSPEIQSGAERAINAILPYFAGADVLGGAGSVGDIFGVNFSQLVIDNEILSWLKAFQNKEELFYDIELDAIDDVSRIDQGAFLYDMSTVTTLRKRGQWLGELRDQTSWFEFDKQGQRGMRDFADDKVRKILAYTDSEPALSTETQKEIEAVLTSIKTETEK